MNYKKVKEFIATYIFGKGVIKNPVVLKYQPFILPVISVIFCLLLLGLVTVPQLLGLIQTFAKLDEIKTQQNSLDSKINQLQKINQDEYREDLETALIALPPEKDVPGALDQVLVMLSGSGLHLDGVSFDNSNDATVKTENYAIRLSVSGDMNQLRAFIEKTKDAPRIIKINSIETSTGPTNVLGATISVLVFYHPLPSNVNTSSEEIPLVTDSDQKLIEKIQENASTIPTLSQLDTSSVQTGKSDPFN